MSACASSCNGVEITGFRSRALPSGSKLISRRQHHKGPVSYHRGALELPTGFNSGYWGRPIIAFTCGRTSLSDARYWLRVFLIEFVFKPLGETAFYRFLLGFSQSSKIPILLGLEVAKSEQWQWIPTKLSCEQFGAICLAPFKHG